MTGENCWATAPLSPRCWTACCITDTFSSAARAAGEPRPAVREKANDKSKSKGDKDAGQSTPAASRLEIQKPRRRSLTIGISPETRNPLPGQPIRPTAEGLDHRFLRSQPRVIGPGSLRKARPRRSDYNHNMHQEGLKTGHNSNVSNRALQMHAPAR